MFAAATGDTPIASRFTLETFTNQIKAAFWEPRLLVVTDPRADRQTLTEASYVNLPNHSVLQTLLCTMWTLPSLAVRELTQMV